MSVEELINELVEEVEQKINELMAEAKMYRGIHSSVVKVKMHSADCLKKPFVLEGEVEMEDVFGAGHIIFVRPISERVVMLLPTSYTLEFPTKTITLRYIDVYVYANNIWLHGRTYSYISDCREIPTKVIERLVEKKITLGEEDG
jgi:hypothetical protein